MVEKKKKGRPSQRQLDETTGGIVWQRLAQHAADIGLDPRITSQIGKLRLKKQFTDAQAAAADLIGRIFGRWERLHGRTRTTRSPSYEFTTAGEIEKPWLWGDENRAPDPEWRDWAEGVERDMADLDRLLKAHPKEARAAVEDLCIENRAVPTWMLNRYVYAVLNEVSVEFGLAPETADVPPLAPTRSKPVPRHSRPRQSRSEKFENGAYAMTRDAASLPAGFLDVAKKGAAADREATVRRIEEGNARRAAQLEEPVS